MAGRASVRSVPILHVPGHCSPGTTDLLPPALPVTSGDLPKRGDQRVLVLHSEFQSYPFRHHQNHRDGEPRPAEYIGLHQGGEPPALPSDLCHGMQGARHQPALPVCGAC